MLELHAKAQNKAYVPFTSDTMMNATVDYYDRNGTANEQMEAHYLLGCVYRDLSDAPKALSAYHDAVEFRSYKIITALGSAASLAKSPPIIWNNPFGRLYFHHRFSFVYL